MTVVKATLEDWPWLKITSDAEYKGKVCQYNSLWNSKLAFHREVFVLRLDTLTVCSHSVREAMTRDNNEDVFVCSRATVPNK